MHGRNLIHAKDLSVAEWLEVKAQGFHELEETPKGFARWTDGKATLTFNVPIHAEKLHVSFAVYNPSGTVVQIDLNETPSHYGYYKPGEHMIKVPLPSSEGLNSIKIHSDSFVPTEVLKTQDVRRLGIYLFELVPLSLVLTSP